MLIKQSILDTEIGRLVPLTKVNSIFFSNSEPFCIISKINLLNLDIIVKKNNIYYLILSKIDEYFKLFNPHAKSIFPYNYYKLVNEYKADIVIQKFFNNIDTYINFLESKNTQFSKTIKHIIFNNNMLNSAKINCCDNVFVIEFNQQIGKSLFITLTSSESLIKNGLSAVDNVEQYNNLYEYHKEQLLMSNPEEFLISNLERVTGDINFSEMVVKSYLVKTEMTTPIQGLSELILWKDTKAKKEYINFFITKYSHLINDSLMTNFEGFNKFLLSVEVQYLQQWEVKEQINELYYQITHELISSFELLYKHK